MAFNPITTGYSYPARTNQGGISNIYVGYYQNDDVMTYTYAGATAANAGQITAFGNTVSFVTVSNRQEQAGMNFTPVYAANGVVSYNQTIEFVVEILSAALSNWVQNLNQGQWYLMAQDVFGNYWMCGAANGCYAISAPGGAGKMIADGSKITLTFEAKEATLPIQVTSAAALTLL